MGSLVSLANENSGFVGAVVSIIVGIGAIWVAFAAWRVSRHKATVEIASRWNDGEIAEIVRRHRSVFSSFDPLDHYPLEGPGGLDEFFQQHPGVRADLNALLNHLDVVAMGFEAGLFDREHVRHLYGYIIVLFYNHFEDFVKAARGRSRRWLEASPEYPRDGPDREKLRWRKREVWSHLEDVAHDLMQDGFAGGQRATRNARRPAPVPKAA